MNFILTLLLTLSCIGCFAKNPSDGQYNFHFCHYQDPDDNPRYCILGHISLFYHDNKLALLIMDIKQVKYNAYIIDIDIQYINITASYIVDKFKPISLNEALSIFPNCFDESNYGF